MDRKALVVWGGWEGHEPEKVARICERELSRHRFSVEVAGTLDAFRDVEKLRALSLIVPVWTMGTIAPDQLGPLLEAVRSGVGIGGCHGGMCDSFRAETEYQFMTGGQWVAHPGNDGVKYTVRITDPDHFITRETSDFEVASEQYYMHVDPAVKVLATTRFPTADGPHEKNGPVDMPVVWTKFYGEGRVFYTSLGHVAAVVEQPEVLRLLTRGLLWAASADAVE
jgi:uncharacterized protein